MGTYNFTCIAKFVAKLTYMYVLCNTYIPRVYIKKYLYQFHRHNKIPSSISQAQPSPPKIWRIHESKFTKCNSGIVNHESEFSNNNS